MSTIILKSWLGNLKLYKFNVPYESDVGVMLVSYQDNFTICQRFQLTRYLGQGQERDSQNRLSKSFVDLVYDFFYQFQNESNLTDQIINYIVSNFSFKDLDIVPPACPVLVFHCYIREFHEDHSPEMDITFFADRILHTLRTRVSILRGGNAVTSVVPIDPPIMEILDCHKSQDLCCLCEKGYPKEDEIVHKTKCDHIFHGSCISKYLLHTPQCPVCYADLSPVDIRTLLFS